MLKSKGSRSTHRVDERGALRDLKFLEELRGADMAELLQILSRYDNKDAPHWKLAAIQRALRKKLQEEQATEPKPETEG